MFDVEPETRLNDSQLRRLRMAMKDCHSLDIEFRMIAAVEKFLRVYNLAPTGVDQRMIRVCYIHHIIRAMRIGDDQYRCS